MGCGASVHLAVPAAPGPAAKAVPLSDCAISVQTPDGARPAVTVINLVPAEVQIDQGTDAADAQAGAELNSALDHSTDSAVDRATGGEDAGSCGMTASELLDSLEEEVESALGSTDALLATLGKLGKAMAPSGHAAEVDDVPLDVQALALPVRSKAEQHLARFSALGQVLVEGASQACAAMPFGAPVAALLGAVYARASLVCVALLSLAACVRPTQQSEALCKYLTLAHHLCAFSLLGYSPGPARVMAAASSAMDSFTEPPH